MITWKDIKGTMLVQAKNLEGFEVKTILLDY